MVCASSDSRTPPKRPSMAGRSPIFGRFLKRGCSIIFSCLILYPLPEVVNKGKFRQRSNSSVVGSALRADFEPQARRCNKLGRCWNSRCNASVMVGKTGSQLWGPPHNGSAKSVPLPKSDGGQGTARPTRHDAGRLQARRAAGRPGWSMPVLREGAPPKVGSAARPRSTTPWCG